MAAKSGKRMGYNLEVMQTYESKILSGFIKPQVILTNQLEVLSNSEKVTCKLLLEFRPILVSGMYRPRPLSGLRAAWAVSVVTIWTIAGCLFLCLCPLIWPYKLPALLYIIVCRSVSLSQ